MAIVVNIQPVFPRPQLVIYAPRDLVRVLLGQALVLHGADIRNSIRRRTEPVHSWLRRTHVAQIDVRIGDWAVLAKNLGRDRVGPRLEHVITKLFGFYRSGGGAGSGVSESLVCRVEERPVPDDWTAYTNAELVGARHRH